MLREVLQAVQAADGPITLRELSRSLNIDPGVLAGMLEHWSRKGKLTVDGQSGLACAETCAPVTCSCGSGAPGAACPFMARLPRTFTMIQPEADKGVL